MRGFPFWLRFREKVARRVATGKEKDVRSAIAEKWDRQVTEKRPDRINWWESEIIRSHVNRLVCGESGLTTNSQGAMQLLRSRWPNRVFQRGVSVGAGYGSKEVRLLRAGIVDRFELFELSEARIERGMQDVKKHGLSDRVSFSTGDAFEEVKSGQYDLVHWNNALHHMFDVVDAVRWSHDVLAPEGVFFMDDYVGPSRMQWSDASIELATRLRKLLPERLLRNPHKPGELFPREARRRSAQSIAREDPSEAADSDRILEAVGKFFPDAEVIRTGGVVYHLALPGIIHNFDESDESDRALLEALLLIDELCLQRPDIETHYAVAIGVKHA